MSSFGKNARRPALILGLLLVANPAAMVVANPLPTTETFTTTGFVGTAGVSGNPVVSFQGMDGGSLTIAAPFTLGQFVSDSAPAGASTTYTDTPIQIAFQPTAIDGAPPTPNATPIVLSGEINGTVRGNDLSHLSVSFVVADPFTTWIGDINTHSLPEPQSVAFYLTGGVLNHLSIDLGETGQPITAELDVAQTIPEPSSIAVFACIAGLIFNRLRKRAKHHDINV